MRRTWIASLLVCTWLASPVGAQEQLAGEPPHKFLQEFDQGYKTLLVISDPLPNVQRALTYAPLQRLWNEGKLSWFIRKTRPNAPLPQLPAVWFILLQNQRWVPSEIALGVHDSGMADLDHLVRTILLSELCDAAQTAEDDAALAKIQEQLAVDVKALRMPPIRLWVNFRAQDDARALLGLASDQAKALAEQHEDLSLHVTEEPDALRVRLSVGDILPDRASRAAVLEGMGWITGEEDKNADAMIEAVAKLRVDAALELHGSGLRLTLGESPQGPALKSADLGPLYQPDDRMILFASWDVARLISAGQGWVELLDQ